jgi:hypothetical protein
MAEVFMKKSLSPRSPRIRAHPLKSMKGMTHPVKYGGSPSRKKFSKKKIHSQQYFYAPEDDDDGMMMGTQIIDDPDDVGTYRSSLDQGSVYSTNSMRSVGQMMKVRQLLSYCFAFFSFAFSFRSLFLL